MNDKKDPARVAAGRKGGSVSAADSCKKAAGLKTAHAARKNSINRQVENLGIPDGFRSLDHFLDTLREFLAARPNAGAELAKYLWPDKPRSHRRSELSKKLKTTRKPRRYPKKNELDAMHLWLISHR